jgi:hypothetical protein
VYCSASEPGASSKREIIGDTNYSTVWVIRDRSGGKVMALMMYPNMSIDITMQALDRQGKYIKLLKV